LRRVAKESQLAVFLNRKSAAGGLVEADFVSARRQKAPVRQNHFSESRMPGIGIRFRWLRTHDPQGTAGGREFVVCVLGLWRFTTASSRSVANVKSAPLEHDPGKVGYRFFPKKIMLK